MSRKHGRGGKVLSLSRTPVKETTPIAVTDPQWEIKAKLRRQLEVAKLMISGIEPKVPATKEECQNMSEIVPPDDPDDELSAIQDEIQNYFKEVSAEIKAINGKLPQPKESCPVHMTTATTAISTEAATTPAPAGTSNARSRRKHKRKKLNVEESPKPSGPTPDVNETIPAIPPAPQPSPPLPDLPLLLPPSDVPKPHSTEEPIETPSKEPVMEFPITSDTPVETTSEINTDVNMDTTEESTVTSVSPEMTTTATNPPPKHLKVFIRGTDYTISDEQIKSELVQLGFAPKKVIQMIKATRFRKCKQAKYIAILPDDNNNQDIYKLKTLLNRPITVERYRGGAKIIQCYRCQGFGHAQRHCEKNPNCMKCSGPHFSYQCTKDPTTPATCVNCKKEHTSNYSGCPARPKKNVRNHQRIFHPDVHDKPTRFLLLVKELSELAKDPDVLAIIKSILPE